MSLLDRIADVTRWNPADIVPVTVDGVEVGWAARSFCPRLARHPDVFVVTDRSVTTAPSLGTGQPLSEAVNAAMRSLYDEDTAGFNRWMDERTLVRRPGGDEVLFAIERAAMETLGIAGHGAHLNGYVRKNGEIHLWVARRSPLLAHDPDKFDQIAAGSCTGGRTLRETLAEEALEEAGIGPAIIQSAVSVGAVGFCMTREWGVRRGINFSFDLELPANFIPASGDGEVAEFILMPGREVADIMRSGPRFKFDSALVVMDFLIRHGVVGPEDPEFLAILEQLRSWTRKTGSDTQWHGSPI